MSNVVKHTKVSAKADPADTSLIRPSDWNAEHTYAGGLDGQFIKFATAQSDKALWDWVADVFLTLQNQSGVTLNAGDVAINDPANNSAVKRTTTPGDTSTVVIAAETIVNGASGRFRLNGLATVAVASTVTRGDNLRTSATAAQAESAGATPTDGAFGRALTSQAGSGSVTALLYGETTQVRQVSIGHLRGFKGDFNTTSTFDMYADAVLVYNPNSNNKSLAFHNPGTQTVNISISGVDGRDQAGAFGANSFIHLYWIGRDDTSVLDVVASVNAPPTGPDLNTVAALQPYDFWIYAGSLRLDGSTNIVRGRYRGAKWVYEPAIQVLTAGNATVETAISTTTAVPSNALDVELEISALANTASQATALRLRVTTGVDALNWKTQTISPGTLHDHASIPNVGQNIYYLRATAQVTDIWVSGYTTPNGAE
jgi:hypothetical protein